METKNMAGTDNVGAKTEQKAPVKTKEAVAKVSKFYVNAVKLKPQPHAPHILKSISSVIVYDSKLGLKEAEVWHDKTTGNIVLATINGIQLDNVTHLITFSK